MKKFFLLFLGFLSILFTAQVKDPVKIDYSIQPLGDNVYEAVFKATIDDTWHLYSKDLPPNSGIPTEIKISGDDVELIGGVEEVGEKHDEYSKAFKARIIYFSNQVDFKQKFKIKNPEKLAKIDAEIYYQTCDDKICLAPNTLSFEKSIENGKVLETETDVAADTAEGIDSNSIKVASLDIENTLTDCGIASETPSENYWSYLLLGFIGGLIALLTPCVFPMIPLTVSFFTKGSKDKSKGKRDAFIYGFFILLIFVLLSVPFHVIDGIAGNIFNEISTSVWLNIAFFVIFLFFAGSFFGYYDITLPSSIANKSSKAEDAGGIIGIFFMALTLVIVSFSCTGPILGSLLGSAVTGSSNVPMLLTFALAGFGVSWAIVFGLLALFPQALQSLPKSGGWMNTVKVVLGFIELGLALKFLSKADLVTKTFLLKRELFIALWILITIGLVLYLFGIIKFPHDDKKAKISPLRKLFGVLGIAFLVYLIQGLIPSERPRLTMLSGILPPVNVSYFHNEEDGIFGMHPENDYFKALALAKKENKLILVDFTGYGCENCRKMEEFVWNEPDILPLLQEEFILASLYVDDKEALPEDEQKSIDMGGGKMKKIKTIGDKWSMFQQVNFNNNSQPHYVLVTPDGQIINKPVSGYMPKEDFKAFLQCGLEYFKKNKK
ncbi:protein-disulfide reductase DsbD family protein [Kaistella antarctica]|uniref:Protein-disulfide reductase n=1 Tax=Kaistella antarctica TaxID=266748 RepID=A0A3S4UNT5_9FLAO|nr:thioredoxin family protein [Kaistella antarctica]KEY20196.1 protein-disulfide reductase [Kaistella antarctica]SEV92473.1 thiol:disulfide interchange protein DsbD [Kaistella antarctica]VEH94899.1 Thiol:disulfide interchange protein DsbD precursor [Kaistella antarctica]